MSTNQISINNLSKVYDNGFEALKKVNLEIKKFYSSEKYSTSLNRSVGKSQ